jgi:serine/threonine-protein kinase
LLVVLLVASGVGSYFGGLFDTILGPNLPVADPYALVITKGQETAPQAVGNVPSEEVLTTLADLMESDGGTATLTLATGDIGETWGDAMLALTDHAQQLDEYRIALNGNQVRLTGLTMNKTLRSTMMETLNAALPGDLSGEVEIELGPRILPPGDVQPLLDRFANCGQLTLVAPRGLGFGQADRIFVTGMMADDASRIGLQDAISEIAGDRPVTVEVEVLSESLCQIETALPRAPSGGFDVLFGFGDRTDPNPDGRYFVGDNPVIDVLIPAEITSGFIWVSVLDISGNVFHLLPNLNRVDNSVDGLRAGRSGPVSVRVAFSLEEVANANRIAFLVDDSTIGKSKIIVIHSDSDPFNGVRPTTESAASYASALKEARDAGGLRVRSIDSGILTTAK